MIWNQNNEKIETNNWTRLLIFDDKINFYFLNMTSVVYCRTFLHFMSSLFNNLKKTNSENVSTPKVGVLNIEFVLKLRIYRSLKRLICLKWIRKKFSTTLHYSTTLHSLSLPLISITSFSLNKKFGKILFHVFNRF